MPSAPLDCCKAGFGSGSGGGGGGRRDDGDSARSDDAFGGGGGENRKDGGGGDADANGVLSPLGPKMSPRIVDSGGAGELLALRAIEPSMAPCAPSMACGSHEERAGRQ